MKKFKFYIITAIAVLACCSFTANAEEAVEDVQETTQVTEAVDVTEATEPTEAASSETTITTVSVTSGTTVTTGTEIVEEIILGDANDDGKLTVSDAAYIARMLAKGIKIDAAENSAADYNQDGKVNVSDAASIARYLAAKTASEIASQNAGMPTYPQKDDYNLKTDSGMKAYVNDMTRYKAFTKYGITAVAYDDTVDVWDYSWDVPEIYLADVDSYLAENDDVLTIGSSVYELPQHYIDNEYSGLFFVAKDESEMADILVKGQTTALDMMVDEFRAQGQDDYSIAAHNITLSWQPTDGVGNYEVYLLWGGQKGRNFKDVESYKKYWNMTDEMYEIAKNNFYNEYIELYETYGDEYMVEYKNWYYTYEDIILDVEKEEMSWAVYKEKVLQLGSYDDPNDYSWLDLTQQQLNRLNEFIAEMSMEEVNEIMKGLKTACINGTVDEYLDEIGA